MQLFNKNVEIPAFIFTQNNYKDPITINMNVVLKVSELIIFVIFIFGFFPIFKLRSKSVKTY